MMLCQNCMSPLSLTPFIAPAAGTIAFLLLLSVTIGAVLALAPFGADGKLITGCADGQSSAESVSLVSLPGEMEADKTSALLDSPEVQTSNSRSQGFICDTDPEECDRFEISLASGRDVPAHSISVSGQSFDPADVADRWWGINE